MKLPVILHTWRSGEGINYFRSSAVSADHLLCILNQLAADHPIHQNLSERTQGVIKYPFQNNLYKCWWIADKIPATNDHETYTRVVFVVSQRDNISLDFDTLWEISDDTSNENLFWQIVDQSTENKNKEKESVDIANHSLPKSSIPSANFDIEYGETVTSRPLDKIDLHIETSPAKKQAAYRGIYISSIIGIVLVVILLTYVYGYIYPFGKQIIQRIPLLVSSNCFVVLNKQGDLPVCPYGTPIYNKDFQKIGVVNAENKQDVKVMLFPERMESPHRYNRAKLYYQPRKLVAIIKLLIDSSEGKEIIEQWENMVAEIQPGIDEINNEIAKIIKEDYPPHVQNQIFKAIYDEDFSHFMMAPLKTQMLDLEKDLENYQWSQIIGSQELERVEEVVEKNYSLLDGVNDFGRIIFLSIVNMKFSNKSKLEAFKETAKYVAKERLGKIGENKEVRKVIKKSAYDILHNVSEAVELTKNGSFLEGKHTKNVKDMYGKQMDHLVQQLKSKGIDVGKEVIIGFWKKIEGNKKIQSIWEERVETKLQSKLGKLTKMWVDKFFTSSNGTKTQLETLSTALMREVLYGVPEPIIVLIETGADKVEPIPLIYDHSF